MTRRIDHAAMFAQVTGRSLTQTDADELRRLLALLPAGLADSPTYIADLMVRYHQWQQLRSTISGASDTFLSQIQARSQVAVAQLVEDAVERIYESTPSTERAFWRAFVMGWVIVISSFALGAVGTATAFGRGWLSPHWLTAEATAKVEFAEVVEGALGPERVDWTRREGSADQSLIDVVSFAEKRGTNADPYHLIRLYESCRYHGQIAYRSRGRQMCRYEPITK